MCPRDRRQDPELCCQTQKESFGTSCLLCLRFSSCSGFLQNSLFALERLVFRICFVTVWGMSPFSLFAIHHIVLKYGGSQKISVHISTYKINTTRTNLHLGLSLQRPILKCVYFLGEGATLYTLFTVPQVLETGTFFTLLILHQVLKLIFILYYYFSSNPQGTPIRMFQRVFSFPIHSLSWCKHNRQFIKFKSCPIYTYFLYTIYRELKWPASTFAYFTRPFTYFYGFDSH
jgi:hypothetical protein